MAKLTIPVVIDPELLPGDRIELEVDGQILLDRIHPEPTRWQRGFGYGIANLRPFGVAPYLPDQIRFGDGRFGQGALCSQHQTLDDFAPGTYSVRQRSILLDGTVGDWSAAQSVTQT